MSQPYVHGYDGAEAQRLQDQAAALVELQARAGGNALIGRTLCSLLVEAGFADVRVSPRMVYVDDSRPHLVEGFTRRTFTAMVRGVRAAAIAAELATPAGKGDGG